MSKFFYFLFILFLYSCSTDKSEESSVRNLEQQFSVLMKQKYDLNIGAFGTKGSEKLNTLVIQFYSSEKMDIPQSRNLLVNVVQDYLKEINSSKQLIIELSNYPFTFENLEVVIFFVDEKYDNYSPPRIACIKLRNGQIRYLVDSKKALPWEEIKAESYEKAKKAVGNTKNSFSVKKTM